ncbi:DNA adenine methylase [Campylobacter sp. VBCF_06 NA8]|uniref:DNA adenine methylase n=1 Tax=Campylobacter sp. VBCF_06 NA8 TaxID=2983822 RepID=UPI0022E99BBE|nr:DNA adenine methylase [Campylobacter sp. VBCF_06 NA8]MDA3046546.1 DNA adenine methylase [Campylobacter sp. VBCF_06 NA8]
MKYIGNKTRLLNFIENSMNSLNLPKNGTFMDLFSGTASVGKYFKDKGYRIISNDFMTYSYVAQYVLLKINEVPKFEKISQNGIEEVLQILNSISPFKGYFFENFAPSGKFKRQYFSDDNAMKIDAIREQIQKWKLDNKINLDEYYVLLFSLINAADFVANISGTYGAYLKIWRSMALKKIQLLEPNITNNNMENLVFQENANDLVRKIVADIVYIDPPYNERQYAPNFHVLETLAVWDKQNLKGKTGQRDYEDKKSKYSQKSNAALAFYDLIDNISAKYIILSYNNEGIINRDDIISILKNSGNLVEFTTEYRRFRTEKDNEKRHYKQCGDKTLEHLYIVTTK